MPRTPPMLVCEVCGKAVPRDSVMTMPDGDPEGWHKHFKAPFDNVWIDVCSDECEKVFLVEKTLALPLFFGADFGSNQATSFVWRKL